MPASYLKIGGELVQDAILDSVTIAQELNQHAWCHIRCRQTEDKRFAAESALGQDLQIFTYDENGAEAILFDGFVLQSKLVYEIFGSFTACITAVTRSYKLDLAPHEAYFRKSTLASVASILASPYSLSADVQCPALPPRNYVQWGESDFAFLKRVADDHKAWLRPTAAGVEVCNSFTSGRTLLWREEDGLYWFAMKGRLEPASFGGAHYDARQMTSKRLDGVSRPPEFTGASSPLVDAVQRESKAKLPAGSVHTDHRAATADEFRSFLEVQAIRSIGTGLVGHGSSRNEAVRAGDTVTLEGVLDAAGTYGVFKLSHQWTRTGYRNEFWCTPSKTWLPSAQPQAAGMRGVVSARVTAHHDPRRMGRIQVQYDWQATGQTAWARMITPHAGADRGFHFLPEIGDEVLVAFENGDAERPYVLGALWNGVDQAPRDEFWGGDIAPNDVKRIVTKSGHRVQLSDSPGKESIVLATPRNLKISLLEKADETSRPMLLLHSAGDICFSAPAGRIHFHSAYLSREVGTSGPAPQTGAGGASPKRAAGPPRPDFAAQAAALRSASAAGIPLAQECSKGKHTS
jgi:type VI secretion system secreted protein VgrG